MDVPTRERARADYPQPESAKAPTVQSSPTPNTKNVPWDMITPEMYIHPESRYLAHEAHQEHAAPPPQHAIYVSKPINHRAESALASYSIVPDPRRTPVASGNHRVAEPTRPDHLVVRYLRRTVANEDVRRPR
ncbi:MAG: hypothetical protein ACPG4T_21885 [Nannocystaceae bacterium]